MKLVIALFALTLNAQVEGLPELGVMLSGTPDNPIVENRANQAIIGHALRVYSMETTLPLNMANFKVRDIWEGRGGLEPGHVEMPLERFWAAPTPAAKFQVRGAVIHTPVKVVLDAVVFANGQVMGPDVTANFAHWATRLSALQELATFALEARQNSSLRPTLWAELERLTTQRTGEDQWKIALASAMRKAHVRDNNDGAAFSAASRIMSIPALWRQQ